MVLIKPNRHQQQSQQLTHLLAFYPAKFLSFYCYCCCVITCVERFYRKDRLVLTRLQKKWKLLQIELFWRISRIWTAARSTQTQIKLNMKLKVREESWQPSLKSNSLHLKGNPPGAEWELRGTVSCIDHQDDEYMFPLGRLHCKHTIKDYRLYLAQALAC